MQLRDLYRALVKIEYEQEVKRGSKYFIGIDYFKAVWKHIVVRDNIIMIYTDDTNVDSIVYELDKEIKDGYYVYTYAAHYDDICFEHYDTLKKAMKEYRKTHINNIMHPKEIICTKALLRFENNAIEVMKLSEEGKLSSSIRQQLYKLKHN